jgi:hypothetical protein
MIADLHAACKALLYMEEVRNSGLRAWHVEFSTKLYTDSAHALRDDEAYYAYETHYDPISDRADRQSHIKQKATNR